MFTQSFATFLGTGQRGRLVTIVLFSEFESWMVLGYFSWGSLKEDMGLIPPKWDSLFSVSRSFWWMYFMSLPISRFIDSCIYVLWWKIIVRQKVWNRWCTFWSTKRFFINKRYPLFCVLPLWKAVLQVCSKYFWSNSCIVALKLWQLLFAVNALNVLPIAFHYSTLLVTNWAKFSQLIVLTPVSTPAWHTRGVQKVMEVALRHPCL